MSLGYPNTEKRVENMTRSGEVLARFGVFGVIYQTRETVFHRDIQILRRELKIRRAAEYF